MINLNDIEKLRSFVRPFIALFLTIIYGVLLILSFVNNLDASAIPKELTVFVFSYDGAWMAIRSYDKRRQNNGQEEKGKV